MTTRNLSIRDDVVFLSNFGSYLKGDVVSPTSLGKNLTIRLWLDGVIKNLNSVEKPSKESLSVLKIEELKVLASQHSIKAKTKTKIVEKLIEIL